MKNQEGSIEVDGHRVWFRRLGEGGVPLLVLHGGPGAGHDYLEPRAGIAGSRLAIFENSAHCAHLEETEAYLETFGAFLAEVDP